MADDSIAKLTGKIVAAYVGSHAVPADQLADLIHSTAVGLRNAGQSPEAPETLTPAVPIKRSVRPDVVICLECGYSGRMLKRHLASAHDLSPTVYRARWGLPGDYPLVAPNYAAQRSEMAIRLGLGRKRQYETGSGSAPRRGRKETAG